MCLSVFHHFLKTGAVGPKVIQHERIIIIIIIGIVIFIVISELSLKYINVKIDYENSQEVRVPSPATATQ